MFYKILTFISLICLTQSQITNDNSTTCFSLINNFVGSCTQESECIGGIFISNCTQNLVCCVTDPEMNSITYDPPRLFNFTLTNFLNLAGNTSRNRALYPLFSRALDDTFIDNCHLAAAFFSQLANESYFFTQFESNQVLNDFDPILGNNATGDGRLYGPRGGILIRGKKNYQEANAKITDLNMDLMEYPESAAFPVTAFKIATWMWNQNLYLIVNNSQARKESLNILGDGTFLNFTMMTHSLTNNIEYLKQRALLFEKAVAELKCTGIKRGRGIECEIGRQRGYAVPICLLDLQKPYCGCDGKFSRSCPYGFNSLQQCRSSSLIKCCLEQCKRGLDLSILIDSSASITLTDFRKMRAFIKSLISKLDISLESSRVSIVRFATTVQIIANFTSFTDRESLLDEVDKIEHESGLTNTAMALNLTNQVILREQNGMRGSELGIPKIVLVLADGQSTEKPELTIPTADLIKKRGINIITLGIGKQIDLEELNGIASSLNDVYTVDDFDKLSLILESLSKAACEQPANLVLDKQIQTKVEKDDYKFFKLELIDQKSNSYFSIELNNTKGMSNLYYSFNDETPKDQDDYLESIPNNSSQNFEERNNLNLEQSKFIIPQNGSKYVYIGVKGLNDENEFNIRVKTLNNVETTQDSFSSSTNSDITTRYNNSSNNSTINNPSSSSKTTTTTSKPKSTTNLPNSAFANNNNIPIHFIAILQIFAIRVFVLT